MQVEGFLKRKTWRGGEHQSLSRLLGQSPNWLQWRKWLESNLSDTSLSTNSCLLIAGMSLFHTLFVFVRFLKKSFFLFKSSNISEQFLCVAISHFPSPWSVLLVSTLSHLFPPAGHRFGRKHILFVLILSFFPLIRKNTHSFTSGPIISVNVNTDGQRQILSFSFNALKRKKSTFPFTFGQHYVPSLPLYIML